MTRCAAAVLACVIAACSARAAEPPRAALEALVARARSHARAHAADPRVRSMTQLFERVRTIGHPRLISVGKTPACWSVPLTDGTTAIATLHARLDGRAAIEWPHRIVAREQHSNLLPEKTFTILDTFPDDRLPTIAFFPPPDVAMMEPAMLDAIELGQLTKVLGLPVLPGDRVLDRLPHATERSYDKQLKESAARVARAGWRTVTGPRSVSAKCWSYAFSYAIDWWNEELGRPAGAYTSYLTGRRERGFDPRTLERWYRREAAREPDRFLYVPAALLDDPVTGEPIISNMDAFASLLVRAADGAALPMGTAHRQLFHLNDGRFEDVVDALRKHGVVIAGEVHRYRGCPLFYSTHAVPIVGHTRIAGAPYLVYLDARMSGRAEPSRLRAYPVSMFSEAYCFPHELTIQARAAPRPGGGVTVRVRLANQAGRTLTGADRVELRGPGGEARAFRAAGASYELALDAAERARFGARAVVHAEQPYYYGASGRGADVEVALER